ncbi:hypothetical protein TrVE_jg13830 [Triparma verrucosa]|uniref:Ankyrin repeat domain-containing protein n=1 Tax=Triparma verrucosa TaxID=1606542 RepID=A0A9W7FKE9_9STRA|nr:hypothetical protein TrVE_jg13830 [Triparma verrucosa]
MGGGASCPVPDKKLQDACKAGDLDAAKAALSEGADMDGKNGGVPPLIMAAWWGQDEIVRWLLSLEDIDTEVTHKICKGGNACHAACGRNYASTLEILIKGGVSRYEDDDNGITVYQILGKYAKGPQKDESKAKEVRDYYTNSRGDGRVTSVKEKIEH